MKVLAVTNRKGGVGKTTIARTLAEYFSIAHKKRTLGIDLDSQCSLSHLFLDMDLSRAGDQPTRPPVHDDYDETDPEQANWSGRSSSADMFYGVDVIPYSAKYPTGADTLDLLPAHKQQLSEIQKQDQPTLKAQVENRVREFLNLADVAQAYDIAIIDTPPGESPLATSALRACTHVLIPMEAEPQSVRGLYEMIAEVREENMRRTLETKIDIVGIQLNRFKVARKLHNQVLDTVKREFQDYVSPVTIPDITGFANRDADTSLPRSLFHLPPSSPPRQKATPFCEYVAVKLFGDEILSDGVSHD